MAFYKLNYGNCRAQSEWVAVISPVESKDNWFIRKRNTYGNIRYMFIRFSLPLIFICVLTSTILLLYSDVFEIININYWALTDVLLYLIFIITTIILNFYTPDFEDKVYLKSEMWISTIVWSIGVILMLIIVIIFIIISNLSRYFHTFLLDLILSLTFFGQSVVLTLYSPLKMSDRDINVFHLKTMDSQMQLQMIHADSKEKRKIDDNKITNEEIMFGNELLSNILSDDKLFFVFMTYLWQTFSADSLLGYIEFYQLKQYLTFTFPKLFKNTIFQKRT